jgi:integrase
MPYKRGKKYIGQTRRNGQKKEKVFKTRKEALAWEAEMRQKSDKDWFGKTDTICLGDWAIKYLDFSKSKFSTKTYKEKVSLFRNFFKFIDSETSPSEVTEGMILEYIQIQKERRSGNAANKDRKNLIAAWNWGMKYLTPKLPSPNPCIVEKMPEARSPRYVPPEEDFLKVLELAEGQDKVLLLFVFATAMRRGEIFRTKVDDLDFAGNKIRAWTRKREDGCWEYDWLPMPNELKKAILWWLENRPIKNHPNLFYCLEDKPHVGIQFGHPFVARKDFLNRLCAQAGVPPFGFHGIRHLRATILFHQGKSVATIQRFLRHKNPNTTVEYLHSMGLDTMNEELKDLSLGSGQILSFRQGRQDEFRPVQKQKAV